MGRCRRSARTLPGRVPPETVVAALTDFSEARLERWPNLRGRFELHAAGEGWADVTEGSTVLGRAVRERGRYAWDDTHVRLTIDTSDIRKPGSAWDYRIVPDGQGGCRIDFALEHHPKGVARLASRGNPAAWRPPLLRQEPRRALRSLASQT